MEIKTCQTCLYMATHEKCDDCLHTKEDYIEYGKTKTMPEFRYLNYTEGNWLDRVIQAEIDGTRNIVIGGQGEAECNTRWTPKETSKHLHRVAEQCGYMCEGLVSNSVIRKISLRIYTSESYFQINWDNSGEKPTMEKIFDVNNPDKGWSWNNKNPFRKSA
jgi:hypothetical protein